MRVVCSIIVLVLALVQSAHADLSTVRYRGEERRHYYLSTEHDIPVGDRELSLSVYLLEGRYVATYSILKRRSANEQEVLSTTEVAGAVSGSSLEGLGTAEVTKQKRNGKPVIKLTLSRDLGGASSGTAVELIWVSSTSAPRSVTGS